LSLITLAFYLFSTSYFSGMLMRSLESQYELPVEPFGDVVIILGGGATSDTPDVGGLGHLSGSAANRVLAGVVLQRKLNVPVIIAGGQVYGDTGNEAQITRRLLKGLGVAQDKIFVEDKSLNTRQNAENVKTILDVNDFKNPILVTSAFHMKRSVFYFDKVGVSVLPYPADYKVNVVSEFGIHRFKPSAGSLENSSIALKEYLGLAAAIFVKY